MIIENAKRVECRVLGCVILTVTYLVFETAFLFYILLPMILFFPILILPLTRILNFFFLFISSSISKLFIYLSFWGIIFPYSIILIPFNFLKKQKDFKFKDDWEKKDFLDELK